MSGLLTPISVMVLVTGLALGGVWLGLRWREANRAHQARIDRRRIRRMVRDRLASEQATEVGDSPPLHRHSDSEGLGA